MKCILWVWKPYSRSKSGYTFNTKEEAEAYFKNNYGHNCPEDSVKHSIEEVREGGGNTT